MLGTVRLSTGVRKIVQENGRVQVHTEQNNTFNVSLKLDGGEGKINPTDIFKLEARYKYISERNT